MTDPAPESTLPAPAERYVPAPADLPPRPHNPPPDPGCHLWLRPLTRAMETFAVDVLHEHYKEVGCKVYASIDGHPFEARIEWHTWTIRGGKKIYIPTGIPGCTLYLCDADAPPPAMIVRDEDVSVVDDEPTDVQPAPDDCEPPQ